MIFRMRSVLLCTLVLVGLHVATFGAEGGLRETRNTSTVTPGRETHVGPIYDAHQRPFDSGTETEMFGPFLFWVHTARIAEGGLRPLFYWAEDRFIDHREWLFVYPLMTFTRYGMEGRWQLIQLFSWSVGRPPSNLEGDARRFTIFPFLFIKRSTLPEENYTALLPIHGTIKDRLGLREIRFTLFPIYLYTRKRNDVETVYVLWPFFSVPVGQGAHGFSFWPLYGHRRQENQFQRDFLLWPIWLRADLDLNTENPRHLRLFLPFYAALRSKDLDFTSAPWPFSTHIEDKKNQYHEHGTPWPFVAFGHGPDRETSRIWPFYGRATAPGRKSAFTLWPLWQQKQMITKDSERTRTRCLLIVFSDLQEKIRGVATVRRRIDWWPLFTWARDDEGNEKFQALSILAPLLPGNHGVAVNYEPLWGFIRWQKMQAGTRTFSLFWNTVRQETGPAQKKLSLLLGLFQYQRTEERKQVRVFYFLKFTTGNNTKTAISKSPEKNVTTQRSR